MKGFPTKCACGTPLVKDGPGKNWRWSFGEPACIPCHGKDRQRAYDETHNRPEERDDIDREDGTPLPVFAWPIGVPAM